MSDSGSAATTTHVIEGRRYDTGEPVRLTTEGPVIRSVEPIFTRECIDRWPWVAPGLFDLQVNGYGGCWFASETLQVDDVVAIVREFQCHGVTRLLPTLVTASSGALEHALGVIVAACRQCDRVQASVMGCHLEGPYISPEDGPRGAHPREHVRPANVEEFERLQRAANGRIRLLTLAPEVAGALALIRHATNHGVTVAIGHTAAGAADIRAAVDAGARLSTHLGNGAHPVLPRHPNYIWEQLAEPRLWASVIGDGFHLPASVLRCVVAVKSSARTIVTCDAAGLAGVDPGTYRTPSGVFEVLEDGRIVIAGQRTLLAGSALTTEYCVLRTAAMTGTPLSVAWDMASRNPARLLGLDPPALVRGARAHLVRFCLVERSTTPPQPAAEDVAIDHAIEIDGVWVDGRRIR